MVAERQFAALDRQIDQLVYELYGVTEEEIKIVEEATADVATKSWVTHKTDDAASSAAGHARGP